MNKLNTQLSKFEISKIRKFNNIASKYDNVIRLTLGQPYFNTPDEVKEKAFEAINENVTKYSSNQGAKPTIDMISSYVKDKFNLNYNFKEIIITAGAQEALALTIKAILNPDDEVIIPTPSYPGYDPLITMSYGHVKHVSTLDSDFKVTPELLDKHITSKTKAILLNYPNNPTGVCLSKEDVLNLADYLKEKDIFIILDEVYNTIIFDTEYNSLAHVTELKDNIIVINAFSKSHSMTGWRIGYALASKEVIQAMTKVHQYIMTCTCTISQHAILGVVDADTSHMHSAYYEAYKYVIDRLDNSKLEYVIPNGAFYIFVNVSSTGLSGEEFALKLLDNEQVAVIPGSAFGDEYSDYIRISYPTTIDNLTLAFDKIEKFIDSI